MLRLLALFALVLLIALFGFGWVIARPWGWNEYASPALYVVYYQVGGQHNPYFIVNADGDVSSQSLASAEGSFVQVDCSPDGRSFAALTDTGHVYVARSDGSSDERSINPIFTTVSVADDGTVALFDPSDDRLLIGGKTITLTSSGHQPNEFDRIDISAQGQLLWMRDFNDIQVVSLANGSVAPYVPHGYQGQWFDNGRMITYDDNMTDAIGDGIYGGEYLMDIGTQMVVKIGDWDLTRPISPDGTKIAAPLPITGVTQRAQVVVYDLFTNANRHILTHDSAHASQPVCFLTFQPQSLISASS